MTQHRQNEQGQEENLKTEISYDEWVAEVASYGAIPVTLHIIVNMVAHTTKAIKKDNYLYVSEYSGGSRLSRRYYRYNASLDHDNVLYWTGGFDA